MMKSVSRLLGLVGVLGFFTLQMTSIAFSEGLCLPLPSEEYGAQYEVQDFTYGILEAEIGSTYEQPTVPLSALWPTPWFPVQNFDGGIYHVANLTTGYTHQVLEWVVFGPLAAFNSEGNYSSEQEDALENQILWSLEARRMTPDPANPGQYLFSMTGDPIHNWAADPVALPGPTRTVCTASTPLSMATNATSSQVGRFLEQSNSSSLQTADSGTQMQSLSPNSIVVEEGQVSSADGGETSLDPGPSCTNQQFYYVAFNVLAAPFALKPPFSVVARGTGLSVGPHSMVQTGSATNGGNWLYVSGTTYTDPRRPDFLSIGYWLKGVPCA